MSRTQKLEEPQQFGKYELIAKLSVGRLGQVYKAKIHGVEGFEKIVTLKAVNLAHSHNPRFVEVLVHEAQRIVSLSHANIAQMIDLGQEPAMGQYYIASEYVPGFDLGRTLSLCGEIGRPLQFEIATFIGSEIAKGLDYAHRRKDFNFNNLQLAHRALSPSNIILSFEGAVKITDFGLSEALKEIPTIDDPGILQLFRYAAPEVALGHPGTDKSDVFSLGLILYELLAGKHPYAHGTASTIRQIATGAEIPALVDSLDVPRQLGTIIDGMLVKNPEGRTPNAGIVFEDLISYIFGNSLRADSRGLSVLMQELRRTEHRLYPEDNTQEAGVREISLSELNTLGASKTADFAAVDESTNAELPSHKLNEIFNADSQGQPSLPSALEEIFNDVRAGNGRAVMVGGSFGKGRTFLADRLVDGLGWRGNTQAFAIQVRSHDVHAPFAVINRILLGCLDAIDAPATTVSAKLLAIGVPPNALKMLESLWRLDPNSSFGIDQKRAMLSQLFLIVLKHVTANGPVAFIIDNIDEIDSTSRDILRDIIGKISDVSVMLVMFSRDPEQARSHFNLGRPDALESVKVVGIEPPSYEQVEGLGERAELLLSLLAIAGGPFDQSELSQITGIPHDELMTEMRDLTDAGYVRLPRAGFFVPGVQDLELWLQETLSRETIAKRASALL